MKIRKRDEVGAPHAKLESPINVGVMCELREYQKKLGFKKVTDCFEMIGTKPTFYSQSPPPDHSLYGDHALHSKYIDHALHSNVC